LFKVITRDMPMMSLSRQVDILSMVAFTSKTYPYH
jgi:hypothetical protein